MYTKAVTELSIKSNVLWPFAINYLYVDWFIFVVLLNERALRLLLDILYRIFQDVNKRAGKPHRYAKSISDLEFRSSLAMKIYRWVFYSQRWKNERKEAKWIKRRYEIRCHEQHIQMTSVFYNASICVSSRMLCSRWQTKKNASNLNSAVSQALCTQCNKQFLSICKYRIWLRWFNTK